MIALKIAFLALFAVSQLKDVSTAPTDFVCGEENIEQITIQELIKLASPKSDDDVEFKQYVGCLWQKQGLVTEDGHLILDNLRNAIKEELNIPGNVAGRKGSDVLNFCSGVHGKSAGQTALKMIRCLGRWKVQAFIDNERNQPV